MDNNLIDRIEKIAKHLKDSNHPGAPQIVPKLTKIVDHIESGGIPGPEEFRYVNFYEPKWILPKCKYISALWECKLGLMEHCKHRPEWEQGINTCKKYAERIGK